MLDRLKAFLADFAPPARGEIDLPLAVAVLLLEAAAMEEGIARQEIEVARRILARQFGLDAEAADALLARAQEERARSGDLVRFTRAIKDAMPYEEREHLAEWLWEIIYADGKAQDLEMAFMRRIAGLIYVPDQANGAARKRILARRGLAG